LRGPAGAASGAASRAAAGVSLEAVVSDLGFDAAASMLRASATPLSSGITPLALSR
jgi:hypothetical protein